MKDKTNLSNNVEERIARICWNTNGWQFPSGDEGKSAGVFTYEQKQHFGHEEWLFDRTKDIEGYHYGYLEPVNRDCYRGKDYNIHLITFSKKSGKLYLGLIRNVHCLSEEEANTAYKIYQKNGWIKEMKASVKHVGGDTKKLDKESIHIFNIRFKFQDVDVDLNSPRLLSEDDPNTKGLYYQLMHMKSPFKFGKASNTDSKRRATRVGVENKSEAKVVYRIEYKKSSYDPVHNIMQNGVKQYLEKSGEYDEVLLEVDNVDVKAKTNNGDWHFFELKTSSPRKCIREALGQILEYAHFPADNKAKKLFIVGQAELSDDEKKYLKYLRSQYNIPVWYRCYSNYSGELGMEE
jgi:hypothetical protein